MDIQIEAGVMEATARVLEPTVKIIHLVVAIHMPANVMTSPLSVVRIGNSSISAIPEPSTLIKEKEELAWA